MCTLRLPAAVYTQVIAAAVLQMPSCYAGQPGRVTAHSFCSSTSYSSLQAAQADMGFRAASCAAC